MPRDRNESRGRLRWSGVTALDVKVGSLLADISDSAPTEPLPLQVTTLQAVSLAVHWPPRSSVGVESVTSAVQDPIAVSTTVLPVHRHRFREAFRSRGIDLHRPRRQWCYSHAEAEPDSDVHRDSVHPAMIVIDSDDRATTTIIVRSTEPTSSPDTDVHVSDPHWGRVAERHLLRALFGLLVECGVELWVPEGLDHVFISYVSGWYRGRRVVRRISRVGFSRSSILEPGAEGVKGTRNTLRAPHRPLGPTGRTHVADVSPVNVDLE